MTLVVLTGLCIAVYFPFWRLRFLFVRVEADDPLRTAFPTYELLGVGTHLLSPIRLNSVQTVEDALDSGLALERGRSSLIPAA